MSNTNAKKEIPTPRADKDATPIEEIVILEERAAVAIGTVGTPK